MSLFSSSLIASRGANSGGSLLGATDDNFKAGFNRELGLEIFGQHASNALLVD